MGVTHLWKLLEKAERPLNLDDYKGAVVAVDVSIWIHQLLHGIKGKDAVQNAYLIGIFNRICTLLHHRIRPIFVFDGNAPQLKKKALVRVRSENRIINMVCVCVCVWCVCVCVYAFGVVTCMNQYAEERGDSIRRHSHVCYPSRSIAEKDEKKTRKFQARLAHVC